ncbi:MAG: hypothetical protein ACREMY_20095 [bacterium]
MSTQYRQGDVFLVRMETLKLQRATPVARDAGRIILARGEATGHAHAISSAEAELLELENGERYLRADAACELVHEEHGAITLEPGLYRVIRQREYGPGMGRYVQD